jgi:hypothetical protein
VDAPVKPGHDKNRMLMSNDAPLKIEDAVNKTCPWSGEPVAVDSLTTYRDAVVGFGTPELRDRFEAAVKHFERAIAERDVPLIARDLF